MRKPKQLDFFKESPPANGSSAQRFRHDRNINSSTFKSATKSATGFANKSATKSATRSTQAHQSLADREANAGLTTEAHAEADGKAKPKVQSRFAPGQIAYGGDPADRPSRRKVMRPLDSKRPVHLVMKSTHARGGLSFLAVKNFVTVGKIIDQRAHQFGVKIHGREIMSNHIHIVATFQNRVALQNFLRTSTALIARAMTGARKGRPFRPAAVAHPVNTKKPASEMSARRKRDALLKNSTHLKRQTRQSVSAPNYSSTDQKQNAQRVRFFDHVVFSRVVNGLRDFVGIKRYLRKNEAECELGAHARHVIEQFERAARDALHKQISVWSR